MTDYDILIRERDEARADRDGLRDAITGACRVAGVSLATPRNPVADVRRLGTLARDWWDLGHEAARASADRITALEEEHAKSLADARLAAHRDGVLQGAAERDRLQGERDRTRTHTEILRGAHRNARKTASMDPPDETSHAHGIEGLGREIVKLRRERSVARALQGNSHVRAVEEGTVERAALAAAFRFKNPAVPLDALARPLATAHGEALVEVPYTTEPDVGDVVRGGFR